MINAVIFDMDGVLFDTELVFDQIWTMLAKKYGYVIQQQMLNNLRGTSGKRMANIIESYWKDADGFLIIDELFANAKAYLSQKIPLKPGVCELIDFLWQHKMPMAVASGSFKDLVLSNLKVSGLIHYFQVISSGDEVSSGKPEPDIFLLTAKRLCQKPQNCLVLEDGIHGVLAGIRAGCETYMVLDKVSPTKEILEKQVPIYNDLTEVLADLKANVIKLMCTHNPGHVKI